MHFDLNSTAFWLGMGAMLAVSGRQLFDIVQDHRASRNPRRLEITVRGKSFVIDAGAIDREDPAKIERAREAVRKAGGPAA